MKKIYFLFLSALIVSCTMKNAENSNPLKFDSTNYKVQELSFEDQTINVRAFEKIAYVTNPVDTVYQVMNIYVPEEYFNGGNINGYTAETAPIFFPNNIGGYMPALPGYAIPPKDSRGFGPRVNTIVAALAHGYVVASAGARGRTLEKEDGTFTGKAPAGLVDLKAAVRYLKYNNDNMPGDANKIVSNGTSAGGAMSSLLGATGNSTDYKSYLDELGAADATDDIFAAQCYCPITNLDHADMAYEWQFNNENTYEKRQWGKPGTDETLTPEQQKVSDDLKVAFPEYVNNLQLKDDSGNLLTLDENGNGSFKDFVKSYVIASAQTALDKGTDLSEHSWIKIENGKVVDLDYDSYIHYMRRMKTPPAFDGLDLSTPENQEFGAVSIDKKHFTEYGLSNSSVEGSTMAESQIIKMMNPMYYISGKQASVAPHWRIRHGAKDKDTGLAIPVILGTSLKNNGYDVNLALPWDRPHSGDYDLDELFAWIDSLCK